MISGLEMRRPVVSDALHAQPYSRLQVLLQMVSHVLQDRLVAVTASESSSQGNASSCSERSQAPLRTAREIILSRNQGLTYRRAVIPGMCEIS